MAEQALVQARMDKELRDEVAEIYNSEIQAARAARKTVK